MFQLEILPLLVASCLWEQRLRDVSGIAFVDNEGARAALVAGRSSQPEANRFIGEIGDRAAETGSLLWFERVASPANLADAPSRGMAPAALPGWNAPVESVVPATLGVRIECLLRGG